MKELKGSDYFPCETTFLHSHLLRLACEIPTLMQLDFCALSICSPGKNQNLEGTEQTNPSPIYLNYWILPMMLFKFNILLN